MIDVLVAAGHPVLTSCRILGVSKPGYYRYRNRPTSPTKMRREWLTGLVREVHVASRGTYRRVHADVTMGMDGHRQFPPGFHPHARRRSV